MMALILSFGILFGGLAWQRPVLALQLTLFALPAYLIRFKAGIPFTLLEVMILINFAVWLIKNFGVLKNGIKNRLVKKGGVIEYPFGIEMIMIVAAGLLGAMVAGLSNESLGIWKAYFFEPVLFTLVIYQVIGRLDIAFRKKYQILIWPLALSALAIALLAIYQKFTGNLIDNPLWQAEATRRVVSVFGYPNAVGLYLETIIVYCFGYLLLIKKETSKPAKLLCSLAVALSICAIIFAKSSGAGLGLVAGFTIFAVLYSKVSRKAFLVGLVMAVIISLSLPQGRAKVMERLTLQDFSGQVRLIGWRESWQMIGDGRLLTGAGLSNFQTAVAQYHVPGFYFNRDRDPDFHRKTVLFDQSYRDKYWQPLEVYMYPHNIILNFWSEVGLLGLLAFVWLIVRFFYFGFRNLPACRQGRDFGPAVTIRDPQSEIQNSGKEQQILIITAMSAMAAIIVHGLVDVPFFKNDLAILFWLPIVILGLYKLEQDAKVFSPKIKK